MRCEGYHGLPVDTVADDPMLFAAVADDDGLDKIEDESRPNIGIGPTSLRHIYIRMFLCLAT